MRRIFISTDYDRLQLIIGDKKNTLGINQLEEKDVLSFNSGKFQSSIKNNSQLFLIKDTTNLDSIHDIKIDKDNDYLMRHSVCNHSDNFAKIHNKGQHEEEDEYYTKVFDIIFDDQSKKADRIIGFLFQEVIVDTDSGKKAFDVSELYREIVRLLTYDYIKMLSSNASPQEVSTEIRNRIVVVGQYFEENGLGLKDEFNHLIHASDLKEFYQILLTHHSSIDSKLFT